MLDQTRPEPLRSPLLDRARPAGVRHGFFTRKGGGSEGIYSSLNVGIGSRDARQAVFMNRARVAATMGVAPECLVTVFQVHSPDVVQVTQPFDDAGRPDADAMVTDQPGLALGVLTADCGPVLFADPEARVIGAAHAGWKGAFAGVLEATIGAMETLGARRDTMCAVLGPAISQDNYEVGPEFVQRFIDADSDNARFFHPSPREAHHLFDLDGYTLARLAAAGVTTDHMARCTYAEEDSFYSYRRATHRGEADYGRQISTIVLGDD